MKYLLILLLWLSAAMAFGQTADFTFQPVGGSLCAPVQVRFTAQTSQGAVGYVWNFGDGSSANGATAVHTFNSTGVFKVSLTVIFDQKAVSVAKDVGILQGNKATVSADRTFICQPGDVTFSATGLHNSHFEWDFGDGTTGTTATGGATHYYNDLQTYTAVVKAIDENGCEAKAAVAIDVKKPELTAIDTSSNFCIGNVVYFKATTLIPVHSTVTSYTWTFDDGTTTTTGTNHVDHPYSTKGQYHPTVSILTSEGCTADFQMDPVFVGVPTSIGTASPVHAQVCASDTAFFQVSSPDADFYIWDFGDSTTRKSPSLQVGHKFHKLGTQSIMVVPYDSYGCAGTAATFPIDIIGVIASYSFNEDCTNRQRLSFANTSLGNVTSFLWDFGDGLQNNTDNNPIHIFLPNSSFNIKLKVDDAVTGCSDTIEKKLYTTPSFFTNRDTGLCRNEGTIYRTRNDNANVNTRYTYFVGGEKIGPATGGALSFYPKQHGLFSDYVIIDNGPGFCADTVHLDHQILVRGPALDFDINPSICTYDSTVIVNNSKPFVVSDSIVSFTWKADDSLFSRAYQPPDYKFLNTGNHKVILYASDINGCQDSLAKSVAVNAIPFLRVIPEADTLCAGTVDTLIAFHNAPITWSSSQTINCVTCDSLFVTPTTNAYYAVEAVTPAGCYSRDTIDIRVYSGFNATALNPASSICPGDTVSLRLQPDSMKVQWFTSAGTYSAAGYDPVVSPAATTQFKAVLTDIAGCFSDSTFFDVNVKPPAYVNAGNDTTVTYYTNFALHPSYSNNIVSYEWTPQGDLNCVFCPDPAGRALKSYNYSIRVVSDSGCVAAGNVNVFIECNDAGLLLPNAFTPNSDHLNDKFYPVGRGIAIIKSFTVFNRNGQVVFTRKNFLPNDKNSGWDGRIKGEPAPMSVYVYTVEAVCDQGQSLIRKGTVTLIR